MKGQRELESLEGESLHPFDGEGPFATVKGVFFQLRTETQPVTSQGEACGSPCGTSVGSVALAQVCPVGWEKS